MAIRRMAAATVLALSPLLLMGAAGISWPAANWSTLPVYMFCGPNERYFNAQELGVLAGTSDRGWAPRWIALGYATLDSYPPEHHNCQAKQASVAAQIRAGAPTLPVYGGTAWDITLCGDTAADRSGAGVSKGPCVMEVDAIMRASPNASMLLHCGGKLVHRGGDHRTVHGFDVAATRAAWAAVFREWMLTGNMSGVVWDGMQHGFDPQDPGTRGDAGCSRVEELAWYAGEEEAARMGRVAVGWDNVTWCNDGSGIGNWSFSSDSPAGLPGKTGEPICSGSMFEFYEGKVLDVLGVWKTAQWQRPYFVPVRGLPGQPTPTGQPFARQLAGFLVASSRHMQLLRTILVFQSLGACVSLSMRDT